MKKNDLDDCDDKIRDKVFHILKTEFTVHRISPEHAIQGCFSFILAVLDMRKVPVEDAKEMFQLILKSYAAERAQK